jgi:Fe-S-cluster containining protein
MAVLKFSGHGRIASSFVSVFMAVLRISYFAWLEMKLIYPAAVRFDCIKCGICCGDTKEKERHVLVLKKEADQIAASTGQSVSEFAKSVEGKKPYFYELKKTEYGKCVFLRKSQCEIYSLRPLVCRFYPFELGTFGKGRYKFQHTTECPGISKGRELEANYFRKLFQLANVQLRPAGFPDDNR